MNFVSSVPDGIIVPNHASLTLASSKITLSCWAQPGSGATTRSLIRKSSASAPFTQYQLRLQKSGGTLAIRFGFQDVSRTTSTSVPFSAWSFIVGTYDGTDLRVYINGVFDSLTNSVGLTMTDNGADLGLGINGEAFDLPMKGELDDIRIYDRALSVNEILELFNLRGQDQNDHGLVSRWPLNEKHPGVDPSGVGSVKDVGPSGNDGNPHNTPTYAEGILAFGRRVA